jgi:tRNA nucleotidyltransferase/poly(A) polymerase
MDINLFVDKCFKQGFNIEKYGLLSSDTKIEPETQIVEKIVEVIKYVEKEIIKEVPVEKIVTKIEYICDKTNENELLLKIQELESENQKFSTINIELEDKLQKFSTITEETTKILHYNQDDKLKLLQGTLLSLKKELSLRDEKLKELENKIKELENIKINQGAVFLKGSNLTQNL